MQKMCDIKCRGNKKKEGEKNISISTRKFCSSLNATGQNKVVEK